MKNNIFFHSSHGQALISLLFFVVIAVTISSAAVVIIIINSLSVNKLSEGNNSYYVAESGMEDALLRLLRNPNFTGETLTVGTGKTQVSVTGSNPIILTSQATLGNFASKIQVKANYSNNILTVLSWQEVF